MTKLRVSFVGLGNAGSFYYNLLKSDEYSQLVSFSLAIDVKETAANKWESEKGIKFSTDINDIDASNTDLAIITSPSGSHAKDSKIVINNSVNVLCEKPIGLKVDEVEKNIQLAKEKNVQYGSVFQNRYNRPIEFAKMALQNSQLGKIISGSVQLQWCREQAYYNDGWHGTWKHDGGVINQQGIHHIDALFYLLGDPNHMAGFEGNISNDLEAEDTFVAAGTFQDSGFFTIEASTALRPDDLKASIEIVGTKGQIGVGGTAINELSFFRVDGKQSPKKLLLQNSETVTSGFGNGHKILINKIIDTWKKELKIILPLNASDALRSLRIVHSLYSSVEQSKIIKFLDKNNSFRLGN